MCGDVMFILYLRVIRMKSAECDTQVMKGGRGMKVSVILCRLCYSLLGRACINIKYESGKRKKGPSKGWQMHPITS